MGNSKRPFRNIAPNGAVSSMNGRLHLIFANVAKGNLAEGISEDLVIGDIGGELVVLAGNGRLGRLGPSCE